MKTFPGKWRTALQDQQARRLGSGSVSRLLAAPVELGSQGATVLGLIAPLASNKVSNVSTQPTLVGAMRWYQNSMFGGTSSRTFPKLILLCEKISRTSRTPLS
ncbi:hypothetical protein CaCOL14_010346 [Colletotrichum acutatum]